MALECTQAERDALAAALKSGVMRVSYSDRTVQYQTPDQMRIILAEMDSYLAGSNAPDSFARLEYGRG